MGGNGSIHRFEGTVEIDGYTFINEGAKSNRLTFALIENVGYVYLRGKGKIILKDGKEVKLPNRQGDEEAYVVSYAYYDDGSVKNITK